LVKNSLARLRNLRSPSFRDHCIAAGVTILGSALPLRPCFTVRAGTIPAHEREQKLFCGQAGSQLCPSLPGAQSVLLFIKTPGFLHFD